MTTPRDEFAQVRDGDPTDAESAPLGAMPRRAGWLAGALALTVVGVGALTGAAIIAFSAQDPAPQDAAPLEPHTTAPPVAAPGVSTPAPGIADLVDPLWLADISAAADIPVRALAAYAGAAIRISELAPSCHLGWNTLAAIGFVESAHASMHDAVLHENGDVAPAIIGIALDGVDSLAVPDSDDGAIDGDIMWDRAVGPMQFIPSTWELVALDANGDGFADINNIDDAALSAGMHLCDIGGDLSVPARWIAAVHAYNPSVAYNNRVAGAANFYASVS